MVYHCDMIIDGRDEHKLLNANDLTDAKRTATRGLRKYGFSKIRVYERLNEWGEAASPIYVKASGGEWEEL